MPLFTRNQKTGAPQRGSAKQTSLLVTLKYIRFNDLFLSTFLPGNKLSARFSMEKRSLPFSRILSLRDTMANPKPLLNMMESKTSLWQLTFWVDLLMFNPRGVT